MSLDTGLNTGRFLLLLGLSAVILNAAPVLHNGLVSAPSKCHINGYTGRIIILRIAVPIHADTNT